MTNSGRRRSIAVDLSLLGGVLGLLCLSAASAGCTRQDTTPVARGEYYAAGKPDYDEFFVKLYRYQLDTANALKLEQAARDELARAVGAAPNAKPSEIAPNLQKMAGELEQAGVEVRFAPSATPDGPELEVKGEPGGAHAARLEAVRAATRKLRSIETLAQSLSELDALRTRSIELDRDVDRVFWTDGAAKRSEVKSNLSDARELIALMSDRRKGIGQSSSELLALLEVTFKPKAPPPQPVAEAEEDEPPKAKKQGRAANQRASTPKKGGARSKPANRPAPKASAAAAAPKPPPAPKPSAAPKADFEP
jgi:hypothetical protein